MQSPNDVPKHTAESFAAKLRDRIRSGEYAPGQVLPTIRKLAEEEKASKSVVEKAIVRLRSEGLLEARQGSKITVRATRLQRVSPARTSAARRSAGFSVQSSDSVDPPRAVDVTVGDVVPPLDIAEALGVEPGTPVLSRYRRYVQGRRSVQLATSYLPTDLTRGTRIEHTDTGPNGIYGRLAEQGHAPTRFSERVVSRAPTPEEIDGAEGREGLGLRREGSLVFEITRHAYAGDRCVEVNRMVLDAEAYELIYNFSAE